MPRLLIITSGDLIRATFTLIAAPGYLITPPRSLITITVKRGSGLGARAGLNASTTPAIDD